MSFNFSELRELIGAIAQTDIGELILKTEEFELTVRKENKNAWVAPTPIAPTASPLPPAIEALPAVAAPAGTPAEAPPPPPSPADKKWVAVSSPMVGTFYRAPAPDEPPFVEVGDRIRSGQTVCIIEAMKLMNEIEAEISGQVMEIAVGNGEPVEYGQTLVWIDPG